MQQGEERMVSEEEVKVNERETDVPIHSTFMDDRQTERGGLRYKMPALHVASASRDHPTAVFRSLTMEHRSLDSAQHKWYTNT